MKANHQDVKRLLATAKGQLEGITRMVEEDRYCIDVSNQILATNAILKKINRMVLQGHIEGCVKDALTENNSEEKVQEILDILEKMSS